MRRTRDQFENPYIECRFQENLRRYGQLPLKRFKPNLPSSQSRHIHCKYPNINNLYHQYTQQKIKLKNISFNSKNSNCSTKQKNNFSFKTSVSNRQQKQIFKTQQKIHQLIAQIDKTYDMFQIEIQSRQNKQQQINVDQQNIQNENKNKLNIVDSNIKQKQSQLQILNKQQKIVHYKKIKEDQFFIKKQEIFSNNFIQKQFECQQVIKQNQELKQEFQSQYFSMKNLELGELRQICSYIHLIEDNEQDYKSKNENIQFISNINQCIKKQQKETPVKNQQVNLINEQKPNLIIKQIECYNGGRIRLYDNLFISKRSLDRVLKKNSIQASLSTILDHHCYLSQRKQSLREKLFNYKSQTNNDK